VTAVRLLWPGPSTRTRALAVQTLVTGILHAGAATGLPAIPGYATMEHTLGQARRTCWPLKHVPLAVPWPWTESGCCGRWSGNDQLCSRLVRAHIFLGP
jgi:hypothetical protein